MTLVMMNPRKYSFIDQFCMSLDQALGGSAHRPYPALHEKEGPLTPEQNQHSAALMRVNHAGEVCAQALYQGQALVSRDKKIREKLCAAAIEEGDHLAWCHQRLKELGSHTSYLNPLWYSGSFVIGLTAGLWGDKWSLGFLAETEQQVVNHLESHLETLPAKDHKSFKVIQQMQEDEAKHRDDAIKLGATELPAFIKKIMSIASKIMVKTAAKI